MSGNSPHSTTSRLLKVVRVSGDEQQGAWRLDTNQLFHTNQAVVSMKVIRSRIQSSLSLVFILSPPFSSF